MKIVEEKVNDILVCRIDGTIDLNNSPQLRKAFDNYTHNNIKKILMDFSSVTYIDSSGLATLIELMQRLKKLDGKFRIYNMCGKVKNIFEITKLYKLFEIFDTQEAALRDF